MKIEDIKFVSMNKHVSYPDSSGPEGNIAQFFLKKITIETNIRSLPVLYIVMCSPIQYESHEFGDFNYRQLQ